MSRKQITMEITVERKYKKPAYTIDKWYINEYSLVMVLKTQTEVLQVL